MKASCKCKSCIYRQKFSGGKNYWSCNYLFDEGKPRECEPGDACTKYKKGPINSRAKNTEKLTNDLYIEFKDDKRYLYER